MENSAISCCNRVRKSITELGDSYRGHDRCRLGRMSLLDCRKEDSWCGLRTLHTSLYWGPFQDLLYLPTYIVFVFIIFMLLTAYVMSKCFTFFIFRFQFLRKKERTIYLYIPLTYCKKNLFWTKLDTKDIITRHIFFICLSILLNFLNYNLVFFSEQQTWW